MRHSDHLREVFLEARRFPLKKKDNKSSDERYVCTSSSFRWVFSTFRSEIDMLFIKTPMLGMKEKKRRKKRKK
jgi:hypothetical protein